MKLLQALVFGALLAVAGCSRGWDKAKLEQKIQSNLNTELIQKNVKGTCTSVTLVQESENKFVGFATFSDGSKRNIDAVVDSANGDIVF